MGHEGNQMARKLIYVPIEILEERYSKQWDHWFTQAFKNEDIEYIRVGDSQERVISTGQFLDVFDTNIYKANQLAEILSIIRANPKDSYSVFFMDLWFPGLEALAYVRDGAGLDIKINGMIHAGTWDEHDFLSRQGMGKWSKGFEYSLFQIADQIFTASVFHVELVEKYFNRKLSHKMPIVRWPVIDPIERNAYKKEDIVVFPHRLAPEKSPEQFDQIAELYKKEYPYSKVQFIKTKDVCKTKAEYYELLNRSKVAVSTAYQETFGIAMVEAYNLWCIPVVPNRLSYCEIFPHRYLSLSGAVAMINNGIENYTDYFFNHRYDSKIDWVRRIIE